MAKKKKKGSDLKTYLNKDPEYQAQLRALQRAFKNYSAQYNSNRTRVNTEYGSSLRTLNEQGTTDRRDIKEDFGARGILHSGVYGQRLGDYNEQFSQKTGDLSKSKANQLTDLLFGKQNFQEEQRLQQEAARQAAIRRRAQKLGSIF